MKIYHLIPILFLLITGFSYSGKKTYDEIPGKSYHPVIPGKKYNYKTNQGNYSMEFDSIQTELNGKKYVKMTVDYGGGDRSTGGYYREENGNVLYIKPGQKHETIEIPSNPEKGLIWYESDSTWKYTISGLSETIKTPQGKYLNCLVIQSENIDRKANPQHFRLYLQYYQRGRGYIGTKIEGTLFSYLDSEF